MGMVIKGPWKPPSTLRLLSELLWLEMLLLQRKEAETKKKEGAP